MAHRGRIYPLSPHRFINSDVDYPWWAADRYQLFWPAGTGSLAASLEGRKFVCETKDLDPPWVVWQGLSIDASLNILYICTLKVALSNDPSFPVDERIELDYIQSLPPGAGPIALYEYSYPPGAQLDIIVGLTPTIYDPTIWNSFLAPYATAVTW